MDAVNEINLSVFEFQNANELNSEELEAIAGGIDWGHIGSLINEGYRDFTQGALMG